MKLRSSLRFIFSYLWWPLILAFGVTVLAFGMNRGSGPLFFNLSYAAIAVSLFYLERWLPHEEEWLHDDGQMLPDLAHTLLNKGLVQIVVVAGTFFGISQSVGHRAAGAYWPEHSPLVLQVTIALLIAEFGLYWAHRIGHESLWFWRFHAVHHSSKKLWFFNTGRFHFVDTVKSITLGMPLLFLAGAPGDIVVWVSGITAYIGILTHCNVEMRFGFLNFIFNTPGLHRWHHSTDLREGNTNYGENLMVYDLLLGTFFNPARRPPAIIGIKETMPGTFVGQLKAPFIWNQIQQENNPKKAASVESGESVSPEDEPTPSPVQL